MLNSLNRDLIGGAICVVLGIVVVAMGVRYGIGTLHEMGAGFIPVTIGVLLIVVGLGIALTPATRASANAVGHEGAGFDPRGWACIIGGLVAFVVLGHWGGLIPAAFFSVFISAMGDRSNSPKSAAILAAIMTVIGVIVFHYFLSLRLPLFRWG
jgi:hypothetical protein